MSPSPRGKPVHIPSSTRPRLEDPAARTAETAAAGLKKGVSACNREACQKKLYANERWWNTSVEAWYCPQCAARINRGCEPLRICFQEGTPEYKEVTNATPGP